MCFSCSVGHPLRVLPDSTVKKREKQKQTYAYHDEPCWIPVTIT